MQLRLSFERGAAVLRGTIPRLHAPGVFRFPASANRRSEVGRLGRRPKNTPIVLVASLFLVVWPGAPGSVLAFLLLVAMPFAPSSVLVPPRCKVPKRWFPEGRHWRPFDGRKQLMHVKFTLDKDPQKRGESYKFAKRLHLDLSCLHLKELMSNLISYNTPRPTPRGDLLDVRCAGQDHHASPALRK